MADTTQASPTIWREQKICWNVEVRADGKILVQVSDLLDDHAARDLSATLHHAANAAEAIQRPPPPIHEPDV